MKKYYLVYEALHHCEGKAWYEPYLQTFEGFQKALYRFNELKTLRSMTGKYRAIVLYRLDKNHRQITLRTTQSHPF